MDPDDVGVAGEGLGSHQVPCLHQGWKGVAHTGWPLSVTALTSLWVRIRLVSQAFLSFVDTCARLTIRITISGSHLLLVAFL